MPRLKKTGEIHDTVTGFDFRVDEPLTPVKSIRLKCLECVCGSPAEVAGCEIYDCPLWLYRSGKRPSTSNKGALFEKNETGVAP